MIVKGIVLIILILGAFAFLGIKIAESIPQKEIKLFFFGLYSITIFTVFNVIISIYFFIKLQDKRGPTGKKGLKGMPGDKGENGMCDSDGSCKLKTVELIIVKKYEEKMNRNINEIEKNIICTFINLNKSNITIINDLNGLDALKTQIDAQINGITSAEVDEINNFSLTSINIERHILTGKLNNITVNRVDYTDISVDNYKSCSSQ